MSLIEEAMYAKVKQQRTEELEEHSRELFCFYTALEVDIRTELQAAGFKDVDSHSHTDWGREFTFNTVDDTERFYDLVEVVETTDWEREDCNSVYIPRTDLYAVYKQLVKCRMESR
jgi:hypothetical protein